MYRVVLIPECLAGSGSPARFRAGIQLHHPQENQISDYRKSKHMPLGSVRVCVRVCVCVPLKPPMKMFGAFL